jgi:hypothetical protein
VLGQENVVPFDQLGAASDLSDPLRPIDPEEEPVIDPSQIYWARKSGPDFISEIKAKEEAFFESARNRGLLAMWVVAYAAHHGLTPDDLRDFATQTIGFSGNELELLRFHLNLIRPYIRHQTSLALGEPAAFKALVSNSDHRSFAKSVLTDKIINSLYKRYSAPLDMDAAEGDGVFGLGATHYRWDFLGGDDMKVPRDIQLEDGTTAQHFSIEKSGEPIVTVVYPWALVQEPRVAGEHQWRMVRELDNRWNLIANFPAKRDELLAVKTDYDRYDFGTLFRLEELYYSSKDQLTVKHFYHRRCAAVPEGRYVMMAGDVILWDGPCPRKRGLPIAVMQSGRFIESTFGYADAWDLIAIQQALNQVNSDEMQNYATFGRQSIAIEKGTEVTLDALAQGTAFYVPPNAQMPKAVQLAAVPATLPDLKSYLHKMLDTVSGQNAASRGDPDPNVRSGEMNALLDSIAIRYQSFRQDAARKFRIDGAQIILDLITRYGETPFLVDIAGIEQRSYVAEFTKEDLSGVQRVDIEQISPLMQSTAGRLQIATALRNMPDEDRAATYEMVTTGNTTRWLKTENSAEMLIRKENERLVTGEGLVPVMPGDNPFKHWPLHNAMLEQLMAADVPDLEAIMRVRLHLQAHTEAYLQLNPLVAQFQQIPPPPPIVPNPMAPRGNMTFEFMLATGQLQGLGQPQQQGANSGAANPAQGGGGMPGAQPPDGGLSAQAAPSDQATMQNSGDVSGQVAGPTGASGNGTPLPQPSSPPAGAMQ